MRRSNMRQHTTPEQTAKLIELGFEKPKSVISYSYPVQSAEQMAYEASLGLDPYLATVDQIEFEYAYSIGELIEMLPEDIEDKDNRGVWYFRNITGISVYYSREERMYWNDLYISFLNEELIDNLYDMVIKLKEEGTI